MVVPGTEGRYSSWLGNVNTISTLAGAKPMQCPDEANQSRRSTGGAGSRPRLRGHLLGAAGYREVPGARADVQLRALRFGKHLHTPEAGVGGGLGGVITQRVLAADVAGHFGGNLVDLLERFGKVGDAAGFGGKHFQGAACVAHF